MGWTDTSVCLTHPDGGEPVEALAQALASQQVDQAWVYGYGAVKSHDFAQENKRVLAAAKSYPHLLVPIALVNPFDAAREIDTLIESGFKGIKILSGWGNWLTIDNIRRTLTPVARKLAEHKLHMSIALEGNFPLRGGSVYLPLLIREACPDLVIVLDHCWSRHTWLDYLTIGEEDKSLWFTLNELPPRMTADIVGHLGIDRIVAGSWYPEHSPDLVFQRLKMALTLNARTLAAKLTKNASRLISGRHAGDLAGK